MAKRCFPLVRPVSRPTVAEYPSFVAAFFALQRELPDIRKDSKAEIPNRPTTHYANLKTVSDAVLPLFAKFGFIWSCQPTVDDGKPVLRYELTHISHTADNPQQRAGLYPIFGDNKPQALGAAITYARRYALGAVIGLTPENEEDAEGGKPGAGRTVSRKAPANAAATADPDQVPGVPLPGENPDRITQPQQRAIFAVLRDLKVTDANRFPTVNPILTAAGYGEIDSFGQLTVAMGKAVYDGLKRELDARTDGAETPT